MAVVDESVHRQEFNRGHAETADMIEHLRLGQPAIGTAQALGYRGMQLGVAAHMQLVDDGPLPGRARCPIFSPGEGGVDHAAAWHERRAVPFIERQVVAGFQFVAEYGWIPFEVSYHGLCVWIKQQLVRIETVALVRLIGPVHAIAVDRSRASVRQKPMPNLISIFGQFDAFDLALAAVVEQAQLDFGGMR
jgi:hypothetical protein